MMINTGQTIWAAVNNIVDDVNDLLANELYYC